MHGETVKLLKYMYIVIKSLKHISLTVYIFK